MLSSTKRLPTACLTAIFITQQFPFDFMMGDGFHRAVLEDIAIKDAVPVGG